MQESLSDKLRELKSLLDEGLLTQEEFNDQKAKLLDGKGDSTAQAPLHAPSSSSAVAESNAAERQKLEKQLSSFGGYGCLDIEPLVVNSILAFFLPILWIPVAVWIIATFVAHAKRSEARGALKAKSIEVSKTPPLRPKRGMASALPQASLSGEPRRMAYVCSLKPPRYLPESNDCRKAINPIRLRNIDYSAP